MRAGECGCGAPQQPSGTAQERGAGPGATCLVLPLQLIPSLQQMPLPEGHTKLPLQLVQGGLRERAAASSFPVGRSIPTKIWVTTKNSRAGSTRSKADLTSRRFPSLSSVSAANWSPKLSPPGFLASISTELILQAAPGGRMVALHLPPHGWCQSPSPGLEEQKGRPSPAKRCWGVASSLPITLRHQMTSFRATRGISCHL